jgi:hypothetical protein
MADFTSSLDKFRKERQDGLVPETEPMQTSTMDAEQKPNPMSSSITRFNQERDALSGVKFKEALKQDPARYAETVKIAREFKAAAPTVESSREVFEQAKRERDAMPEVDEVFKGKDFPVARVFLNDHDNAARIHDDVSTLKKLEQSISGGLEYLGGRYEKGQVQSELSELSSRKLMNRFIPGEPLTEEENKRIEYLTQQLRSEEYTEQRNEFMVTLGSAAEQLSGSLLPIINAGAEAYNTVLPVSVGTGAAMGGVLTSPTGIGAPVGVAGGAAMGLTRGLAVGAPLAKASAVKQMFDLEAGLAYNEFLNETDAEGNTLDEDVAASMAVTYGVVAAGLEGLSLKALGSTFSGASKVGKQALKQRIKTVMKDKTLRSNLMDLSRKYLTYVGAESATEFTQDYAQSIFNEIAKASDDGSFKDSDIHTVVDVGLSKDTLLRSAHAANEGRRAAMVFGGVGTVTSVIAEGVGAETQTAGEQRKLDELADIAKNSKALQDGRGDVVSEFLEQAVPEDAQVYITPEALDNYIKENQIDAESDPALQGLSGQLDEALSNGTSVSMSVSDFVTKLSNSEHYDALRDHMHMDENSYSMAEVKAAVEQRDRYIESLTAKANENVDMYEESQRIYQDIDAQLQRTGRMSKDVARLSAELVPAYATTLAMNKGITVQQAYEQMGVLSTEGPYAERQADLQRRAERMDIILDQGETFSPETLTYPTAPRDLWYSNADFRERGARAITMSPQQYLESVRPLDIDEASRDNIDDLKNHIQSGRQLDPLAIYEDGKEDGRHRAVAAMELGIDEVPVLAFGDQFTDAAETTLQQEAPQQPWYFSALAQGASAVKQDVLPAKSWLNAIKKQPGVKQEEIEWTGLQEWLDAQEGKVSKQEVVDYLEQGGVQVEEVVLGKDGLSFEERAARMEELVDLENEGTITEDQQAELDVLEQEVQQGVEDDDTKYEEYTIPGGENYREVLLTLPAEQFDDKELQRLRNELRELENSYDPATDFYNPDTEDPTPFALKTRELRKRIAELEKGTGAARKTSGAAGRQDTFKSSHWDEPNVLAHLRLNDRNVNGEQVLFIEEIQSDWSLEGRKKGFEGEQGETQKQFGVKIGDSDPNIFFDTEEEAIQRVERIRDNFDEPLTVVPVEREVTTGVRQKAAPAAPFVQDSEWQNLALKRVMKMAVDQGYDRVAWVTGEQTAERYSLDKKVKRIEYSDNGDGTFSYSVIGTNDAEVHGAEAATPNEISDIVGKDIAERMTNGEGTEVDGDKHLKGDDLKIEAKWARELYDQAVPNWMKKFGKKYKARLEVIEMGGSKQLSLPVTEKMRESVSEGLPLFQEGQQQNLAVVHNLSAENLMHVDELGGLAAPSLAVIRTDRADFDSFGEITLVADPDILNDPKAHTCDADIYTTRHPRADTEVDSKQWKSFQKNELSTLPEWISDVPRGHEVEGPDPYRALHGSRGVQHLYLQSIGRVPAPAKEKTPAWVKKVSKLEDAGAMLGDDPRFHKILLEEAQRIDSMLEAEGMKAELVAENFDESGKPFLAYADQKSREARSIIGRGGVDIRATYRKMDNILSTKKHRKQYAQFVKDLEKRLTGRKRIFKGFTPAGDRRYAPYTLENVVKEMTRKIQNSENFNYGAGNIRAAHAKKLKNTKAVQKLRDKIISGADFIELKESSNEALTDTLEALKPYYRFDAEGFSYIDDATRALAEGARGLNEAFEMDAEARTIAYEFIETLKDMPTSYFESKVARAMDLSEFTGAVVPKGTDKEAVDILRGAGMTVRYYEPGNAQDRMKKVQGFSNLMFNRRGNVKGYFSPDRNFIRLTEASDESTFLHELGHYFLEATRRANPEMMDTVNGWFGENTADIAKEANRYLGDMQNVQLNQRDNLERNLPLAETEKFKTGQPVTFDFLHNTESATSILGVPEPDSPYDRWYEPSGRYVLETQQIPETLPSGWISGQIAFNNPLVLDGAQWKRDLSNLFEGKRGKELSLAVMEAGYDGVVTVVEGGTSEILDLTTFDENKALFQDTTEQLNESDTITEDMVRAFLSEGTTGRNEVDSAIFRATHEQFARGFEKYLAEGRAPSLQLREAFRAFKRWLTALWRRLRYDPEVSLNQTARQMFDRMLATEDQIAEVEAVERYQPLFTDAAMAGMTEEQFAEYQERMENPTERAKESLYSKLLKELTRQTEDWWKDEKATRAAEIEDKLSEQKVYKAANVLTKRKGRVKFDTDAVKEHLGITNINKEAPWLRGMTIRDGSGMSPDDVAAVLEYESGDKMLKELAETTPIKKEADRRAEAEMKAEHGDILNDGTLQAEALDAVRNEKRGEMILAELKALGRSFNRDTSDKAALKQLAKENIGKMPLSKIRPNRYRKAEVKAAVAAREAVLNNDKQAALVQKQKQAMNFYLYREAQEARRKADVIVRYTKRFSKKTTRKEITKGGESYMQQIDGILSRFAFKESMKAVEQERADIRSWAEEQMRNGANIQLTEFVLDEKMRQHYKQIPYNDLLGVYESLRNLNHVARFINKLDRQGEKIEFEELVQQIQEHVGKRPQKFKTTRSTVEERTPVRSFLADQTKIPFMMSWLDGGKRAGFMHQIIMQPISDAAWEEIALTKEVGKPIMDAIKNRSAEEVKRHNKKIYIPEIDDTLLGSQILSVALNVGTQSNLEKMLKGEGWIPADTPTEQISAENSPELQAILSHMTKSDWDLVELVWRQIDKLFEPMAEVHKRTSGLTLPKIDGIDVATPFGVIKGGYYPMKYDPNRDNRAAMNEERQQAGIDLMFTEQGSFAPTAQTGAKHERTQYHAPVRFSLDVIPNHIQEVVKYITHYEAVRQVHKITNDQRVKNAITAVLGRDETRQLRPWLEDVVNDGRSTGTKTFIPRIMSHLRMGATYTIMGFKASTGLVQMLGLSNSYAEIGSKYMNKALRQVIGSPRKMSEAYEFSKEKSSVMRNRMETMDREIYTALKSLKKKPGRLATLQETSMKHIALVQTYTVDLPTWFGAYTKAKEQSDIDPDNYASYAEYEAAVDKHAVNVADWSVENIQGSGMVKDAAALYRKKGETDQLFTMFMTFFSSLWNMQRDLVKGASEGYHTPTDTAARVMFMFMLPVLLESLMRDGLPDEDDEEWMQDYVRDLALYPLMTVPIARDVASHVIGDFKYQMSPISGIVSKGLDGVEGVTDYENLTWYKTKNAIKFTGAVLHIPGTNQAMGTAEHLYQVMEEGEDLTLRELLYGPEWED